MLFSDVEQQAIEMGLLHDWPRNAVEAVHRGMGLCQAACLYGVPKSTLNNKVNNHTKVKSGPKPILSCDLEDRIE